jgi:hypothetical protein
MNRRKSIKGIPAHAHAQADKTTGCMGDSNYRKQQPAPGTVALQCKTVFIDENPSD